jgi:hypothetical protein
MFASSLIGWGRRCRTLERDVDRRVPDLGRRLFLTLCRSVTCFGKGTPELGIAGGDAHPSQFATDSSLEEAGFELPVPLVIGALRTPKIAREL